ncbi:MAG: hypothetical protein G01um101470_188 [Parcubacteria group bacterium Gr01-1014_70]|nr:MAG: hypothetical protein G01um101470_188 [Parcubacteria group bacterium Gr01-1014_70]
MDYGPIVVHIRTTAERGAIYSAVEMLLDALFKKNTDILRIIETEMSSVVGRSLKHALSELPDTSPAFLEQYVEGFRKRLGELRVLTLEIAFEPTEETLAVLISWVRRNLGVDVIMDIAVDRGLFGGARVSYEGRYKEINLAALIERAMRDNLQESIQTLLERTKAYL